MKKKFQENPNWYLFSINKTLTNEKTQNNYILLHCDVIVYQNEIQHSLKSQKLFIIEIVLKVKANFLSMCKIKGHVEKLSSIWLWRLVLVLKSFEFIL